MNPDLLLQPPLPRKADQPRFWITPPGSSISLLTAETARAHDGPVVMVARDNPHAHRLERELAVFARGLEVLHFPDWETLPYDRFAPHPEIISQRIAALNRMPAARRGVLVVPVATLMQRLAPRSHISGFGISVCRGQQMNLEAEQQRLDAAGYRNVAQVSDPGEFAVRGALIDIYPMGAAMPYRIELLDDEVDSIRGFDPETQRSAGTIDRVDLLPGREYPFDEDARKQFRQRLRDRFAIDPRKCSLYIDVRQGIAPAGIEYYLPLFFEQTETLFDYLDPSALFVLESETRQAAETFWQQAGSRYEQRAHDVERPILPPVELLLEPEELRRCLNQRLRVELVEPDHKHAIDLGIRPLPKIALEPRAAAPAAALKDWLASNPQPCLLAADSAGRREALAGQLQNEGIATRQTEDWASFLADGANADAVTRPPALAVAPLEQGFYLQQPPIAVLTESDLLGEAARPRRSKRREAVRDPATIIRDLSALDEGAPIVHMDHGVGRYRGLETLDVGNMDGEFLAIEYAGGAKLYVPVAQLALVNRYTGSAPELAPLHSLGGDAWEKQRRKAAEKVRDAAAELLAIHAQRAARKGSAMPLDRTMYQQFAAGFPFEETPDQLQAIEAVLTDLAAPTSMDRVVCGDVGFGKTEVALRAAFVAATAGRQVAVLVPTTLLAQQHYSNFADRFADWPIKVEVLSRFRSKKEIDTTLERLADGDLDIVIGTHKLLRPEIRFRNLGLVVIDEEQRFGVRHKEQLKKLRAEVDVLTLTATPIPRTLDMAMAGLRDLSIIATPPEHRLAVKTLISHYDSAMIQEALQRELQRGGQVYFLHNQVDSIDRVARELGEMMPEARIRIAHGQMPERELEQVMLDFHRQRFNLLVCTTIIESGIDIPSANTIIVNRADRFGLAQLHQLRGRVGRSHHRAYAYMIVPERGAMTRDAEKRLDALASLEELGAGFTLATHDLEIRGAGELLGEGQSGQIQQIGFALYNELLDRAVKALRSGKVADFDLGSGHQTDIVLHIPALIPDDYLPDVHTRLTLYKRIASAANEEELRELQIEMIDRFGLLPQPTKNLFAITSLKLIATVLGIRKFELGAEGGRILFREQPDIDPASVLQLVQGEPRRYQLDGPDKLRVRRELPQPAERIEAARDLLARFRRQTAAA